MPRTIAFQWYDSDMKQRISGALSVAMRNPKWLIGALIAAVLGGIAAMQFEHAYTEDAPSSLGQVIDAHECAQGLTKIVLPRGIEDGFAPAGIEPSSLSGRLLRNGYYADLARGPNSTTRLRGYDQGGTDAVLMDHFEVSGEVVSGLIVLRRTGLGNGASNDSVLLGDLDTLATPELLHSGRTFSAPLTDTGGLSTTLADGSHLVIIPLERLKAIGRDSAAPANALAYLGRNGHPVDVDILVGDDSKIDALALLACQRPDQARGVTFTEHRLKPMGKDVSWMGCMIDHSQRSCDPLAGDRLCSAPGPIACYHDGGRTAPAALADIGLADTAFIGGNVRLTAPVRGDRFARLAEANRFCATSFGKGWRVLSYHEGGGGQVVSYSDIAPSTRALVNIRDQQYANCWDRDIAR